MEDILIINGVEYRRVEVEKETLISSTSQYDFNDGNGLVPACRHVNPNGSKGGWVADTAKVEATVYVWPDAAVFGNAQGFWRCSGLRICSGFWRCSGFRICSG